MRKVRLPLFVSVRCFTPSPWQAASAVTTYIARWMAAEPAWPCTPATGRRRWISF